VSRSILIAIIAVAALAGAYFGKTRIDADQAQSIATAEAPAPSVRRIISLAPSVTEVAFSVGLDEAVVGVTRYCTFPPSARQKAQIGGFVDPNYEAMVDLEPDLVIMTTAHRDHLRNLERLGLETLVVNHDTLDGIIESITVIGDRCGARGLAAAMRAKLEEHIARIRAKTEGLPRPRVLVAVGRDDLGGSLNRIYVAEQFYGDLLDIAGGENVIHRSAIATPSLTGEGILQLNPEVVVEIVPGPSLTIDDTTNLILSWNSLPQLEAVKEGRVHILSGDYVAIPGPRVIDILDDLAAALHPEVDWEAR
jgi:iron complex transport system substrate-binding protein